MEFSKPLKKITDFLKSQKIPHMIFGGVANSIYGEPRQTFDIDIKLKLDFQKELDKFIQEIKKISKILCANPKEFILKSSVLPVEILNIKIDLVFALLDFEFEAIKRANKKTFDDLTIRVTTPEDLIIQKAISERDKDWIDIKGIIKNQRNKLDWNYILPCIKEISNWIGNSNIFKEIEKLKNEK